MVAGNHPLYDQRFSCSDVSRISGEQKEYNEGYDPSYSEHDAHEAVASHGENEPPQRRPQGAAESVGARVEGHHGAPILGDLGQGQIAGTRGPERRENDY